MPARDSEEGPAGGTVVDLLAHVDRHFHFAGFDVVPAQLEATDGADEAAALVLGRAGREAVADLFGDATGGGVAGRAGGAGGTEAVLPRARLAAEAALRARLLSAQH